MIGRAVLEIYKLKRVASTQSAKFTSNDELAAPYIPTHDATLRVSEIYTYIFPSQAAV